MAVSPRLISALGWCWASVGACAPPFAFAAAAAGEAEIARGFAVTAATGLFLGGLALSAARGSRRPAGTATSLRLLLYGWATTPLLAAPPLAAAAGGAGAGVFEAYSAMTTTGASVIDPDQAPLCVIYWRALLQWLGGLASVMLAVTIFASLDARGPGLQRSTLLTVEGDDLFTNFGRAFRRMGALYGALTAAGALLLLVFGARAMDAPPLAMSAIATGGMAPQSGPLADWLPPGAILVVALLCGLGAWNMALQFELATRRRLVRAPGDLRLMLILSAACALGAAATAGPGVIPAAALDAWFAVTTAGYETASGAPVPVVALVALALIGGSAVSTAGGLKAPRVLLLLRRAREELELLSHPSAAVQTRFAGRTVGEEALLSVAVYALAYPLALGLGGVAVGLAGAEFGQAWALAGAALANAGPVAGADYAALPEPVLYALIPAMIAGRLEVVALVSAVFVIISRD